jgi:predicted lipoprotein with Yx(FWY)xxD motif
MYARSRHEPRRARAIASLAAVVALLALSACGDDDSSDGDGDGAATSDSTVTTIESDAPTTDPQPITTGLATIGTAETEFGTVLTDEYGYTLYVFDEDEGQPGPTCVDECSDKWPGLLVDEIVTPEDIDVDLGLVERDDGFQQVTINGRPAYTMAEETEPGQTLCQGGDGVWWIVSFNGEPIRSTEPPATSGPLG